MKTHEMCARLQNNKIQDERVKVHHYMLPTEYIQKLDLQFMNRNDIDVSILSLSAPGLAFASSAEEATKLCRSVNEYAKEISTNHPRQFGFFASFFIHPTFGKTWGAPPNPTIPRPMIDFPHEITRTVISLITSKVVRDFSNCKIILSHGGGTLPYVATRDVHQTADLGLKDKTAEDFIREAKSFYFNLALTGFKAPIKLL
ncbi:hypothetical protein COCCADRAFT_42269 [Bipolaris zeicola 26-R-13]|uniref:Amidohydrolase-related domain-containing protein n=1 Tax=Cochliobolus carbonum (strain 26-R-13) TaxID=930089 RepID=W6XNB7_COCC2|nr:uncharacterized protein COCCADRAFT_42269 [Bipolaris zeicola 26-R-13]EUC26740.1 hypothetical protein COCCADRAFT_42269 [Bipolaris zeicola 26-R-13]